MISREVLVWRGLHSAPCSRVIHRFICTSAKAGPAQGRRLKSAPHDDAFVLPSREPDEDVGRCGWIGADRIMRGMKRIDDFAPGQHAVFTKTFTDDDVRRFVEITGDVNPLHVDDSFAASTRFGRRVIHGMLTASILSTMVGMLIPGTGAIYRSQTLMFLRPVHVGDTVTAHFVVRTVDRARHRLTIDAYIENENGERVLEGVCEAGLLR
jgi:acyl dehydratase